MADRTGVSLKFCIVLDQDFYSDMAQALARLRPCVEIDEYSGMMRSRCRVPSYSRYFIVGTLVLEDNRAGKGLTSPAGSLAVDTSEESAPRTIRVSYDGSNAISVCSADGQYLLSGAEDTHLIIKHSRDNTVIGNIELHGDDLVFAAAFSLDGAVLVIAFRYGVCNVWNVAALHEEPQTAKTSAPISALGGTSDGTFNIWDANNPALLQSTQYDGAATFIVFSADGRMMATSGTEQACRVWDIASLDLNAPKLVLSGHSDVITSAAFSHNRQHIVTRLHDCGCHVWSTDSGRELARLYLYPRPVRSVAFSPDGARIVSNSDDATLNVLDVQTGAGMLSLEVQRGTVCGIAYSPEGAYIACASTGGTVSVGNAGDGELVRTNGMHDRGGAVASVYLHFAPEWDGHCEGTRSRGSGSEMLAATCDDSAKIVGLRCLVHYRHLFN